MSHREGDPMPSLVEMCHENFIEGYESVSRVVPGGEVERIGGLTAVRSGMPGSSFNVVFGLNRPKSIAQVRDGIKRLFLRTNTEFQIVTLPETLDELGPILREMNLTEREVFPGMVLDPIPDATPSPREGFEIRQVRGSDEVADLLRTGASGFATPPNYFDVWKAGILAGASVPWSRGANYLGYVGGKPAATSIRIRTGDIAGIYFVSTLPEFRRRGFGEAMTRRAITDGRKTGCTMSYLQASKMGRPIYERIGFRVIEEYSEWKAKPRSESIMESDSVSLRKPSLVQAPIRKISENSPSRPMVF
jgi:ribosomal protein S18 acetylase RimI-like enzyme